MRIPRPALHCLLLLFVLVGAGCASGGTGDSATDPAAANTSNQTEPDLAATEAPTAEPARNPARDVHDAAVARWLDGEITSYVTTFTSLGSPDEILGTVTVVDGAVTESTVGDDFFVPLTVQDQLARMNAALVAMEADPTLVGNEDTCEGLFPDYDYDPETGAPTRLHNANPCEDSIVIGISTVAS